MPFYKYHLNIIAPWRDFQGGHICPSQMAHVIIDATPDSLEFVDDIQDDPSLMAALRALKAVATNRNSPRSQFDEAWNLFRAWADKPWVDDSEDTKMCQIKI